MTTLEELEGKIKANPYAREFYQLALEYQKIGKFTEAKSVLLKGLERNQGNFQARLLLAKILIAENNFAEAKKQIERVLLIVPDNVSANHLAAEISEALGDKEAALRYYKVVELFEPDRQGIKEKISELEGENQEAEEETKKEEKTDEQQVQIPFEEEKEEQISDIKYEEEKEEPISANEISENILEEQEKEEKTLAEQSIEEVEEQQFSEEKIEKKIEEDLIKPDATEPFQPFKEDEEKEVMKGEEETSTEIGDDTLTDLLEETSTSEKQEEQKEEETEINKLEENQNFEGEDKEESVTQEEQELQEQEEEEKEEVSSLSTATLAELYEKQGYPDKAIEIYQHILLKEPEREDIRNRIQKLKREMLGMEAQDDVGVVDVKSALRGKRIEALKMWLKKIREADNV